MTEREFKKRLYTNKKLSNIPNDSISLVYESIFEEILKVIVEEPVKIRLFGTFSLRDNVAYISTIHGEKMMIPAKKKIKFRVSKKTEKQINDIFKNI